MKLSFSKFLWVLCALMVPFMANAVEQKNISQDNPTLLVTELSDFVVKTLNDHRSQFEQDNQQVVDFAYANVLPYVDTDRMARYALGKNWRSATEQQQKAFTKAFTENLIRSYSQSFLNLKIESVTVSPAVIEKPGRASVSSTVVQQEGKPAEVLYRVYQDKQSKKWFLYDVVIENVSMLLSYRSVYSNAVATQGLDAVIKELQDKNQQVLAN
ncbi:phospholipid-binding protein MlaC [Thiomicrorhabdus indica]|uniref:MlaC/ttg2D family ABC transporter substrate-binding protein n=1 Tax=Thiomicrorhabdus indica TaxID=2267253 RepID=UPI00102DE802|nr:ABC transporter substrate-binding protein [Thiomicrorhabdus indica]